MLRQLTRFGKLCKPISAIMPSLQVPEKGVSSFAKLDKIPNTETPYNSCYMVLDVKRLNILVYFP